MGGMQKLCKCLTCNRIIQSGGIARHRAMHRDRKEDCRIRFSDGKTVSYKFSDQERKE
jgi:hypothetical protein